ncbi:hypothetical protein BC477_03545 [Clavibacter michiganensis subsp. michiganensis]|uniref:Uncharacterized protein n=1 Tax=Clavibacter michiganensis subsp. michiganensis TaxID=33013 RepID=A0A251XK27_CLAMM|nr:hypothetical protein BC477_03545 [Clavibacter michiganensis subsp. michiganensis]OUE03786.1 hypothetical protein CMMCAS07_02480 [Clavibacter michiganensis subsp. michiganensis]
MQLGSGNVAEPRWREWREQLAGIGGTSPLLHFVDAPGSRIELSTTHPGGLAQFITGKTTLLSSLIRDDLALRSARKAANRITQKGIELVSARGIESIHLAIGLAEWRFADEQFRAPVLLRPLAIRRHGSDYEVRLKGQPFLNPALARALEEQFQITLDADSFVALAVQNGAFKPQPVIDRLRGLTSHLPAFAVQPRLVVSSFAEVGRALAEDAEHLDHLVIDAIAGNPTAKWGVGEAYAPVDPIPQDQRPPVTDTLLLDADPEQEYVIAQINAGNSLVVTTLPGTGGTQTIVNSIGCLVAQNKRVLVVSPAPPRSRASASASPTWACPASRSPEVPQARRGAVHRPQREGRARADRRGRRRARAPPPRAARLPLRARPSGQGPRRLRARRARRAVAPRPPAGSAGHDARLTRDAVVAIAHDRASAAASLVKAASLGEFRYGPGDSPWYGATFSTSAAATHAHDLAKSLSADGLPRLLERADELIGQTRMRAYTSIDELGVYLRLLLDVRETLDKFQPVVFDRSLSEIIAATGSRRDAPEMTSITRRRLRKLAREYVRPGVHISDMHESLKAIQKQRILWQRYVAVGSTPEVPRGISDVHVRYQEVAADLKVLDEPLSMLTRPPRSASSPWTSCARRWPSSPRTARCSRTCRSAPRCWRSFVVSTWIRCSATSPTGTCRRRPSPPSSSSRGGSPCWSRCSRATRRSSTRTRACSTASSPTSDSSTRRTPPPARACSPGSSRRRGRSAWSTGPRRRTTCASCSADPLPSTPRPSTTPRPTSRAPSRRSGSHRPTRCRRSQTRCRSTRCSSWTPAP